MDGGQGKALADTYPIAVPIPIEKSVDFELDGQRGFAKSSLPVGGGIEANSVAEMLSVTPDFEAVGTTYKPKKAVRHPQMPHTPSESPRHFAAAG